MALGGGDIDWRSGKVWQRIGYTASAAWMIFVVVATGNDVTHPLFNFIFIVPLAGWIIGIAVAKLIARRRPPDS
ncbi:MAG: hypothetical protein QNJ94_15425 [Alphaproteobacteria bacterium]|nr:hypothetical protein [Alphaproteobacteria bacterium]